MTINNEEQGLDYSDHIVARIIKVSYLGEPTHWELDLRDPKGDDIGGATAPTFAGIVDELYSIIRGGDKYSDYQINEWTEFDANNKVGIDSEDN